MYKYKCNECDTKFIIKNDYIRHIKSKKKCNNSENINKEIRCSKCNKTFCNKYTLRRHVLHFCNYQIECEKNNNINLDTCNDNINLESIDQDLAKHINYGKIINTTSGLEDPTSMLKENMIFKSPIIKDFKCDYCDKIFTRQDNLKRHLDKICLKKKIKEEKDIILYQLLEEMNKKVKNVELKNQQLENELSIIKNNNVNHSKNSNNILNNNSNNNSNNNISNNNILNNNNTQIHNNINIVAFGKEDLNQLVSDSVCKKILFKGFEAVPQLIEYIPKELCSC